jgi:hypothetical protein
MVGAETAAECGLRVVEQHPLCRLRSADELRLGSSRTAIALIFEVSMGRPHSDFHLSLGNYVGGIDATPLRSRD